jgi:hypothetical protein
MIVGRPMNAIQVALHFEHPQKEENLELLNHFLKYEKTIRDEFSSEEIIFDDEWGKNWTQIYVEREISGLSDEGVEWASGTMVKLHRILKPILDEYYSNS